jgi:hypothetical protein
MYDSLAMTELDHSIVCVRCKHTSALHPCRLATEAPYVYAPCIAQDGNDRCDCREFQVVGKA